MIAGRAIVFGLFVTLCCGAWRAEDQGFKLTLAKAKLKAAQSQLDAVRLDPNATELSKAQAAAAVDSANVQVLEIQGGLNRKPTTTTATTTTATTTTASTDAVDESGDTVDDSKAGEVDAEEADEGEAGAAENPLNKTASGIETILAEPITTLLEKVPVWVEDKIMPAVPTEYRYPLWYVFRVVWPLVDMIVATRVLSVLPNVAIWMVINPVLAIRFIIIHIIPIILIGGSAYSAPWCSGWQSVWKVFLAADATLYAVALIACLAEPKQRRALLDPRMPPTLVLVLCLSPVHTICVMTMMYRNSDAYDHDVREMPMPYEEILIQNLASYSGVALFLVDVIALIGACVQWIPWWSPGMGCHPCIVAPVALGANIAGCLLNYYLVKNHDVYMDWAKGLQGSALE